MYIMLITYNFDPDYVTVRCETEKEAIEKMNEYFEEEIETIVKEVGYNPTPVVVDDTEKILVYGENVPLLDYRGFDYAIYKVIYVNHNNE